MRISRVLLVLGIWTAVLPYLGFPVSWKDILTTVTGLGLIYISYILYKDFKIGEVREEVFDNFSENSDFNEDEIISEASEIYLKEE